MACVGDKREGSGMLDREKEDHQDGHGGVVLPARRNKGVREMETEDRRRRRREVVVSGRTSGVACGGGGRSVQVMCLVQCV